MGSRGYFIGTTIELNKQLMEAEGHMKVKISILAITMLLFLGLNTSNALAVNSFNFFGEPPGR